MNKPIRLGVVMDPISRIQVKKDSTLAILLEAEKRGWEIYYFEQADLWVENGIASGRARRLHVYADEQHWFDFAEETLQELQQLDVILMRKDPPFNMEYIYTTYLLEIAEHQGVRVINKPQALRDANEKIFASWFPQCMPETLITRNASQIKDFIKKHRNAVLKPLHTMGGGSIFYLTADDLNTNVVIETLTQKGESYIMVQRFISQIREQGDKRIFLINGEAVPYALARIPHAGDIRGNLMAGGKGIGVKLTTQDQWICQQIGPTLREKGLSFVGIDVIGDYLTEINVTSPTCIREIDSYFNINISAQFLDYVESTLN